MCGNSQLDEERKRLVESHIELAEREARFFCARWPRSDFEDTRSDAFYGLVYAARVYQKEKGSFSNYAMLRIKFMMKRGRQMRSNTKRRDWEAGEFMNFASLNSTIHDGDIEIIDTLIAPEERAKTLLDDFTNIIDTREYLIMKLRFYYGLTQSEIARLVNLSQMQISRIERAVLERMRESLDMAA